MKISRWQSSFVLSQSSSIVIGNFDGVHLGHQKMLQQCREVADKNQLYSIALSFFPHTKLLTCGDGPSIISNLQDRAFYLSQAKIDHWLVLSFREKLRKTTAEEFIEDYLIRALKIKFLTIGEDFRFGYQGRGDAQLLQQYADKYNFQVKIIPTICDGSQRISSSKIRIALQNKDIAAAAEMLGHFPIFTGIVRNGAGRGEKLSARTANLHVPENWAVADGVYAVEVELVETGEKFIAVANIGTAPTFNSAKRKIEAHLLDVQRDLYGQKLRISVQKFLRNIVKFEDVASLQTQIHQDIAATRDFFVCSNK